MKLLTVFTGGTISCSVSDGVLAPDSQNGSYLLGLARQAGVRDDFETVQPFSVLSENMTPDCLRQLRRCITERLGEGYDGVLVTHGTDTLAYTAAYLDFVLGAQDTPVVLVSANYPLRDSRSNGLQNFVAAVEFLRTGKRGVFVAYHNTGDSRTTIHRGREVLPQAPATAGRRFTAAERSCRRRHMRTAFSACLCSPMAGWRAACGRGTPVTRSALGRTCPPAS